MLTQCPKCETIYRLDAADLGAAQGFVECGDCGEQFNALSRLADEPKFTSESLSFRSVPELALSLPEHPDLPTPSGPTFVLMDSEESTVATEAVAPEQTAQAPIDVEQETFFEVASAVAPDADAVFEITPPAATEEDKFPEILPVAGNAAAADTEFETAPLAAAVPSTSIDIGVINPPAQTLSESEHAILFTDPQAEFEDDDPEDLDRIDIDDVPEILKKEVAALNRPRRTGMRWLWMLLAVLLLVGLSFQLAWVFRGKIVAASPSTLPLYLTVCERFGCRIETAAETDSIELLARDVRDHPQYRDSLLVNATLVSHSQSTTLFPVIQLGLFDQMGEVIGIRRFEPHEYLDKSIDLDDGMPPNRSVYIVLEIAGVGARAVGFEFTFL